MPTMRSNQRTKRMKNALVATILLFFNGCAANQVSKPKRVLNKVPADDVRRHIDRTFCEPKG